MLPDCVPNAFAFPIAAFRIAPSCVRTALAASGATPGSCAPNAFGVRSARVSRGARAFRIAHSGSRVRAGRSQSRSAEHLADELVYDPWLWACLRFTPHRMHLPAPSLHFMRGGHFTSCLDPPPIFCISQPPAFISLGVRIDKNAVFLPIIFAASKPPRRNISTPAIFAPQPSKP